MSSVSSTRSIEMPGAAMSVRNIVACSPVRAITMPNFAPTAPVISHLRPSMTQSPPSRRAVVASMSGSEPAPPSGSVIRNAERTVPAASGARKRCFCSWVATRSSRCMLPSSGAMQFIATGPSSE